MFAEHWDAIAPRPLLVNGTALGEVVVASTSDFKVGQMVIVTAVGQLPVTLKVKSVPSPTLLTVGRDDGNSAGAYDLSAYTVAANAAIQANFQGRPGLNTAVIQRWVYEEEPTVALRTMLVDEFGRNLTSTVMGSQTALDVNVINPAGLVGTTVDVSTQAAVALNNVTFTTLIDYVIPPGRKFYLTKIVASGATPAAEVEAVFINGLSTTIIRHYKINSVVPTVLDVVPQEPEYVGGVSTIIRVRARVADNVHPLTGSVGWAAINGYIV